MKGSSLVGLIFVTVTILTVKAAYEELCARFADGVKFREPGNCQAYVTCKNGNGKVTACPTGELYDKDSSTCVSASKLSDSYCDGPCSAAADEGKWVADPLSCNGFYFCRNGQALYGTCYEGYNFNEAYQLCDFPSDFPCYGVPDFCKLLPNKVKFSHPEACNQYFTCSSKKQIVENCTEKYYDVATATCVAKSIATCEVHPPPMGICGKNSQPIVDKPVSDGVTCRGYFYCAYKGPNLADPNPVWYQCPVGTFFNSASKSCGDPTLVSCGYNRCDGRGTMLVLAQNEYCQHYHVCVDGKDTGVRECPRDMFFDESLQACSHEEIASPICDY